MRSRSERQARKRARYARKNRWLHEDVTLMEWYRMRWTQLITPVFGMVWCATFFFYLGSDSFWWFRPIMALMFVFETLLLLAPYYTYRTIVLPHMIFTHKLNAINAIRQRYVDRLAELGPSPDAMTVIHVESERGDDDGRAIQ